MAVATAALVHQHSCEQATLSGPSQSTSHRTRANQPARQSSRIPQPFQTIIICVFLQRCPQEFYRAASTASANCAPMALHISSPGSTMPSRTAKKHQPTPPPYRETHCYGIRLLDRLLVRNEQLIIAGGCWVVLQRPMQMTSSK